MRLVAFSRPPALVVAMRRGFFADEGIDVTFTRTASSREQLDALVRGEFDIAHTAADNIVARADAGADLRIVLVVSRGAEHRLIGGAAIRTPADMRGRRLGVDAPESGHAVLAYVLLREAGVERGAYEVVPLGSTRERYAALVDGRIDAAMLNAPHDERALSAGCHVLADAASRFPQHPGLTVAVAGTWAAAHRAEVVAYCRALLRAARFAADPTNREPVIDDLASDAGIGRDEAAHAFAREHVVEPPTVEQMAAAVSAVCAARRDAGLATGPFDVSRYFDASFVDAPESERAR